MQGGYRANAGRRANKDEVFDHIKEALKRSTGGDLDAKEAMATIWERVVTEAINGNYAYTKLLFEYYYGKPVETTDLNIPEGTKITVTRKVVTSAEHKSKPVT